MSTNLPDPPLESEAPVTLPEVIGKIAASMQGDRMSTGDLAALRRVDPQKPYSPALWKVLGRASVQNSFYAPPRHNPDEREMQWAALLMGMAITSGLHNPAIPFGKAMADAGWSDLRFERLMRQQGEDLFNAVRQLASYLSSKSAAGNWTQMAQLLFHQEGPQAEKVRRQIARDYYGAVFKNEKSKG